MNVLFLTSDYPPNLIGGVGIYIEQFAKHLARRGHQAFVLTRTDGTPCEYVDGGVRVWRIRSESIGWLEPIRQHVPEFVRRVEYSMAVAKQLRTIIRRYSIDAIESCESRAEGFWYFLFHRRPTLLIKLHTPDGLIFPLNQAPSSADLSLMLMLEEWWLRRAASLIGLTEAVTRRVGALYRLRTDAAPQVRVPVDTQFFVPPPSPRAADELRVLYVGRLEFRKGIHVLLRALPRIMKEVPAVQLTLIGQDSGLRWLVDEYRRHPSYGERITWLPSASREELREAYQRSHVCVVPSLWENHPTVALEAMSSGCVVIASQAGGVPEIIQHGVTGLLVPAGSSQALASAVLKLHADPHARDQLGVSARAQMERRYDRERVFDETIALYERLLSERN